MKKIRRRTTTGKNVLRIIRERLSPHRCASCGRILHGVSNSVNSKATKKGASQKSINRIFGGNLCSSCTRTVIKERARSM